MKKIALVLGCVSQIIFCSDSKKADELFRTHIRGRSPLKRKLSSEQQKKWLREMEALIALQINVNKKNTWSEVHNAILSSICHFKLTSDTDLKGLHEALLNLEARCQIALSFGIDLHAERPKHYLTWGLDNCEIPWRAAEWHKTFLQHFLEKDTYSKGLIARTFPEEYKTILTLLTHKPNTDAK